MVGSATRLKHKEELCCEGRIMPWDPVLKTEQVDLIGILPQIPYRQRRKRNPCASPLTTGMISSRLLWPCCPLRFSGLVIGIITQETVFTSVTVTSVGLGWKHPHDRLGESLPKRIDAHWRGWVHGTEESIASPTYWQVNLVTVPLDKRAQMPSSTDDLEFRPLPQGFFFFFVPQNRKAKDCIRLE